MSGCSRLFANRRARRKIDEPVLTPVCRGEPVDNAVADALGRHLHVTVPRHVHRQGHRRVADERDVKETLALLFLASVNVKLPIMAAAAEAVILKGRRQSIRLCAGHN